MNIINGQIEKRNSWALAHRGSTSYTHFDSASLKRADRRQERRTLNASIKKVDLDDIRLEMGMLFMPVQTVVEAPPAAMQISHSVSYGVSVTRKAKFQRAVKEVIVATVLSSLYY